MTRTDAKITQYEDGEFLITIVESASTYEAWVGLKSIGVSELMFGVAKSNASFEMTYEVFLEMVQNSLPEYEELFAEILND